MFAWAIADIKGRGNTPAFYSQLHSDRRVIN